MVELQGLSLGLLFALHSSEAFFLSPAAVAPSAGGLSSRGMMDGAPSLNRNYPVDICGEKEGARRRGWGTLRMGNLEEVPESLSDKVLAVECAETGGTLDCYAERFAVLDNQRYLVAYPKDPAVAIAFDEDGEVAPVPIDDPLMDRLFPLAEACLADLGIDVTLLRTPTTLTARGLDDLVGSVRDEAEASTDTAALGSDVGLEEAGVKGGVEGDEEDDDFFDDADEVELLGEFMLEGEEFLLVRFMDPLLVLAKEAEPGRFVLLNAEEDQDANPAVEDMLSKDAL